MIDADALKKEVDNFPNCYNGWSDTYDKAYIIEAIEEAPTIEPKRGEWVNQHKWSNGFFERECSVCGAMKPLLRHTAKINFCPNCGADMREREGE